MRWFYLAIVVVFVAALIIFVFQNAQSVSMSFLALGLTLPLAVLVVHRLCAGGADRRKPLRASSGVRSQAPGASALERAPLVMRAMVLNRPHERLKMEERPDPSPGPGEVLIRVHACGVCRTDLHVVDGELTEPKPAVVPGHEIVGMIEQVGDVAHLAIGDRVGVPWLGWTCGTCEFCRSGRENLCDRARFTGYTIDGGYAEFATADARFCFKLPEAYSDIEVAPLLCAGLIGYRALQMAGEGKRLGLYGFGAAAHIAVQVARHRGRRLCLHQAR